MTVRELLSMQIDIDVCDDVTDDLYIAFVGPQKLTAEGEKHFAEVLDYPIEFHNDVAVIMIEEPDDGWERRLKKATEFFHSAAGYCSAEKYDRWFGKV